MRVPASLLVLSALLSGGIAVPVAAFDWGGSLEVTGGYSGAQGSEEPTATLGTSLRFWTTANFDERTTLLAKASVSNAASLGLGPHSPFTDTVSGGLDTLVLNGEFFRLGRTDFRDLGGLALNTKLDGVQIGLSLGSLDFRLWTGTSAFLFKSASTIILSEDDVKDRQVFENWAEPATLWASPRVAAGFETAFRQVFPDQNLFLTLLGQYDLRPDQAQADEKAYTDVAKRQGAPLSTAYLGAGWEGRVVGPLYGSLRGYVSTGATLTAVGVPVTEAAQSKDKTEVQYQIWRPTVLAAGLGAANLTLLVPAMSYLLVDAGLQVGSWDPDGATPDKNAAPTPRSTSPTLYTGWTGISRTGGALIFNPQPANLVTASLIASIKPFEAVQVASTTQFQARATSAPISETTIANSRGWYLGTESDLAILWRPTSDFGGSLTAGVFIPNTELLKRTLEYKLQASVSLNF